MKQPAVYIMSNKPNGTLYVGVTSNLAQRVYEHKNNINCLFTTKYKCKMLVYYEIGSEGDPMDSAIFREKQLKAGSRFKKLSLINSMNPNWDDLYESMMS